jgi:hypothetical protein
LDCGLRHVGEGILFGNDAALGGGVEDVQGLRQPLVRPHLRVAHGLDQAACKSCLVVASVYLATDVHRHCAYPQAISTTAVCASRSIRSSKLENLPMVPSPDEFVDVLTSMLEEPATVSDPPRRVTDDLKLLREANSRLRAVAVQLSNLVGDLPPLPR